VRVVGSPDVLNPPLGDLGVGPDTTGGPEASQEFGEKDLAPLARPHRLLDAGRIKRDGDLVRRAEQ
jgi:hypothetical protein